VIQTALPISMVTPIFSGSKGDAQKTGKRVTVMGNNPGEVTVGTTDDRSAAAERVQFAPGLWRTGLQRQDLSIPGREVIQSRVDIDPEAPAVKHTHPGEEILYVLDGSLEYQVEGQPTRTFHAGDALTVPAGAVHAVRNVGSGTGSVLATDVVEKGKPLLTLAE
jgi:quercetin dioxygenase-like cupin family protein